MLITLCIKKNHVKTSSLSEKLSWEICKWKREPSVRAFIEMIWNKFPNDIGPPNLQEVWGQQVFWKLEINNCIQQG